MEQTRIRLLVALFKASRDETVKIVGSVPESHRFKQLAPGKATPTWLLGHLARTVDRLILEWTLQEPPVFQPEVGQLFAPEHAGGVAPTTNPDDYPDWDTLLANYVTCTDRAIDGLKQLSDDDLDKPLPGDMPDAYRERFPTILSILRLLGNHDAYHRGQMGLLAKLD